MMSGTSPIKNALAMPTTRHHPLPKSGRNASGVKWQYGVSRILAVISDASAKGRDKEGYSFLVYH
jgi:hypothetical protein